MWRLTANHLAEQEGGYEPQRAYNGQLLVFGLEGWNTPFGYVALSIEAFDLPVFDAGCTDMSWMGQVRKTVGQVNFPDLELTVRDFVDKATSALVWQWIQQVHNNSFTGVFGDFMGFLNNPLQATAQAIGAGTSILGVGLSGVVPPEGGRGLARDYKKLGVVVLVAPDGSHHRGYLLKGLWPKKFVPGRVDHEADDILRGTLTLSIDTAEYLGGITAVQDIIENPAEALSGLI